MTSSASEVAVEIRATIAVVRLMRPAKRNALSDALMAEIDAAFAALPKSVGCAVLTGSGDHFSAGLDLSEIRERDAVEGLQHSRSWHRILGNLEFGRIPVVAALHGAGVKLGVVSNKEDALTKSVVSHYFPGLFDAVAGHTLGTPTKPDPHLVNGMRAAFGLSAQQVLYVGDSGVDIETARNAGLAGCGVLWGFRTGDELCGAGASYLVRSPEDIRVLVLDA